jgi:hypothetical protein
MCKKNIIKNFNSIVSDLLNQTSGIVGKKYLFYFNQITRINCYQPMEYFILYSKDHKEDIIKENPNYFLNEDNIKKELKGKDEYLSEIMRLKEIYININEESRKNLWKYLKAMVILSDEFIEITKCYQTVM